LFVRDVTATLVHQVLEGIWTEKHETATRVRSRIENVLDYAISKGYREGPNPARLKGNLDHMLAPSKKVAKVEHHAALDVVAMPAFWERLRAVEGQGATALAFAILTAARSGRGAWRNLGRDRLQRGGLDGAGKSHEDDQGASRPALDGRTRVAAVVARRRAG